MKIKKSFLAGIIALLTVIPMSFSGCGENGGKTYSDWTAVDSSENVTVSLEESVIDENSVEELVSQNDGPLFWEVTNKNGEGKLYLLGSMHATNETAYPLRSAIMDAYKKCESLAVEADIVAYETDMDAQIKSMEQMVYNDGTKIYDHIPVETYDKLKEILTENGLYIASFDNYKPIMWASMVDSIILGKSGLSTDFGIDQFFLKLAKEEGKQIREIESVEFQLEMFNSFSDELQTLMFSPYIEDMEKQVDIINELFELWKGTDIKAFEKYLNEENEATTAKEQTLLDEYNKAMLIDRNIGMADKAEEYLQDGKNCFYVVGAAHMIGDDGIVKLLEQRGYTVTLVE